MANVQMSANMEVSVKPRVGLAVLFALLVVLFAIALVAGMIVGRLYLAILLIPIAFFYEASRRSRNSTKIKRVQLDVSCADGNLSLLMPRTKLMKDGSYADQRYTASLSDVPSIRMGEKGLVEISANRLSCETLGAGGEVLESHPRIAAVIAFRSDNASIELLKRFLRENSLEYLLN